MSAEQRASSTNGIWMCSDHGRAIDAPDAAFTVEVLHEWKRRAEIESRARVLRDAVVLRSPDISNAQTVNRIRAAARADLEVFRKTIRWPPTSVPLTLRADDFDDSVNTAELARIVVSLDDLILVAPPGMGKTATLFQVAEGLIGTDRGIPLLVPLGDWATEGVAILASILKRPGFRGISEDELRISAALPGVVLLLDGWNELDASARNRARVEVMALKAQLPEIGLLIATRRQALDVPFIGTRIDLLPLNEEQQLQISVALRGDAGARILDEAWRKAGVRELVTIPLYLMALLSLPTGAPFPTTKEQVLSHFVAAHETEAARAEALRAIVRGLQQHYLESLAADATRTTSTAIADSEARRIISATATMLADAGQISTKPHPDEVLDVLVSSHALTRSGDALAISFQHQQFQEWYASHSVERRITQATTDPTGFDAVKADTFNLPAWEEAILFAVERLARGDSCQRAACGLAILAAFEVDPILAAEMIFRATDDVWYQVAVKIQDWVARWQAPGIADRALRFMLTSGRPEFFHRIWPLITSDDQQVSLGALRNCRRFRPSILGAEAATQIQQLSRDAREVLLHEMASRSDVDGLDLASAIATRDQDPKVQASVVEALAFRRANRHVADVLRNADSKTFDLIVQQDVLEDVLDERVMQGIDAARRRQRLGELSNSDSLRRILNRRGNEDRSEELISIISMMDIDRTKDSAMQLIYEVRNRYPCAVVEALLARLRAGRTMFYGADDILASANLALEEEALVKVVLANPSQSDDLADAAASVLGPGAVGQLVTAFLDAESRVRSSDAVADSDRETYHVLRARIAHTTGANLVAAALACSTQADNAAMTILAEILARHSNEGDRGRPFDEDAKAIIRRLAINWGNRMLASGEASRGQLASVAGLAPQAPDAGLLPILKQLLDENLRRYRSYREAAQASGWRPGKAVNEAQQPMTHQFMRAFLAIMAPQTTALMNEYLMDPHFGELAAQVLGQQWMATAEPQKDRRFGDGLDFSIVAQKRLMHASDPDGTTAQAETLFAAIDRLLAGTPTDEQKWLAVALGTVAVRLPHGRRQRAIQHLIELAPWRARSTLLTNLVLSGEVLDVEVVAAGLAQTLEAAKTASWILTQSEGYEIKVWLWLLPFVNHPLESLALIRNLPPEQRDPYRLSRMVTALADSPSEEAEEVLFELAEEDSRFYYQHEWRAAVLRLASETSALRFVSLVAQGTFPCKGVDEWTLAREIGNLFQLHPNVRRHTYSLLLDGAKEAGLSVLAVAVAEFPDVDGLLMLASLERRLNRSFVSRRNLQDAVTERVPSEHWQGAYEVVPVRAIELRRKLLAMTKEGEPEDICARWLRAIDSLRDQHGMPETEPRHPDLASGRQWPILIPTTVAE